MPYSGPVQVVWKKALQIHNSKAGSGKDMDLNVPDPTAGQVLPCIPAGFSLVGLILVEVFGILNQFRIQAIPADLVLLCLYSCTWQNDDFSPTK